MNSYDLNHNLFSITPRKISNGASQCLCDHCSTNLKKHDSYVDVYAYQFKGQLDELSNIQKDVAIENNGIVPNFDYSASYGQPFYAKILPPKKPFGQFEYRNNNGMYVNPYRYANDACETKCCIGDCREYGDALEKYLKCRESCPRQSIEYVTKKCGPPPINPALNGCKKNWTYSSPEGYDPRFFRFPNNK